MNAKDIKKINFSPQSSVIVITIHCSLSQSRLASMALHMLTPQHQVIKLMDCMFQRSSNYRFSYIYPSHLEWETTVQSSN
jgi:hypothetical protein